MSVPISDDEYSYSFLLLPKMKTATSTEQSTESSCAFLNRPPLRFRKVLWVGNRLSVFSAFLCARCRDGSESTYTERFLSSLIALISIFLRPILNQMAG